MRPGKLLTASTVALLCVIWGTTWSVIRVGLRGIPPFTGVALRFAIAAVLLLAVSYAMRVELGRKPREKLLWLLTGIFAFAVSYGVVYWAEQWVPSGLTAVLFATYPLFVAIIGHFLLPAERMGGLERVGILIGFAGVGVIFSSDFEALGGRQVAVASAVMLLSPSAAALSSVLVKRWNDGIHPFSLAAVPMLVSAVIMGAVAVGFERDLPIVWNRASVGALLYLAVAGSAITFTLYYWLLSYLPAKRLALIAYVIPIIAVWIGALLDEPITLHAMIGSSMVIVGVVLAIHMPKRQSPARSKTTE